MIVKNSIGRVATYTISMTNYDWSLVTLILRLILRLSLKFNHNVPFNGDVDLYIGYNYNNDNNNNNIYRYDNECIVGSDCIKDRKDEPNARKEKKRKEKKKKKRRKDKKI